MNKKYVIPLVGYISWCGLGFVRGVNYYHYKHTKSPKKEQYLYLDAVGYGLFGLGMYTNPFFLPIVVYRELYRLEVNIRNLENEKKSDSYNEVI